MIMNMYDLKYVLRSGRRTPFSTCLAICLLALGIGVNAAFFSIVYSFWFEPPVTQQPSTFAQIYASYTRWFPRAERIHAFTARDCDSLISRTHAFKEIAAWQPLQMTFNARNHSVTGLLTTCNIFSVYGSVRPLIGRSFSASDCILGTPQHVIVLGEGIWRHSYGGDPSIIGKTLSVNNRLFTVIGIMPAELSALGEGIEAWVPYTIQPELNGGNDAFKNNKIAWLTLGGRLREGVTYRTAAAELQVDLQAEDHLYGERHSTLKLTNGAMINDPDLRSFGIAAAPLTMAPLFMQLLLVCITVACLYLARVSAQKSEIAIRLALGCSRFRLTKLYMLEGLLQGCCAAFFGLIIAVKLPPIIWHNLVNTNAFSAAIPFWLLFSYTLGLVLFVSVITSILPIRESQRQDLVTLLKSFDRTLTIRLPGFDIAIIVQLATCVLLLLGSLTFVHLADRISNHNIGFDSQHIMIVPMGRYAPREVIEERLESLPGFVSSAYSTVLPFQPTENSEIQKLGGGQNMQVQGVIDTVSEDYFRTVGIPILYGRGFRHEDTAGSREMSNVVISRSFANRLWGSTNPLNQVVELPDKTKGLIIGVAADASSEKYGRPDGPRLYLIRHDDHPEGQLLLRFNGDASTMRRNIAEVIKDVDPSHLETPITVGELLDRKAEKVRSLAKIATFTSMLGLIVAATGIYGVIAIRTNQRVREIGIRMILGASRASILLSIVKTALFQISLGLVAGGILSLPAGIVLKRMTANTALIVRGVDPRAYTEAILAMLMIIIGATWVPAMRVLRIDPAETLRRD